MAYTEEMTTSEILLRLASMRNELLQAVNDIEKISKNICYKAEQTEPQRDEFELFDREALILLIECQRERIAELLAKTEPQTYVINPQEPTNDEKCFECDDFFTCGGQCNKIEDEPQNGYHTFNGTSVYVSRLEDEPQTDWETEKRDNSLCYKCVKECDRRVLNRYTIECNQYEPKDEPTISKMEQVDKDINVRSKDEPTTQTETQNSNLTFKTLEYCDICDHKGCEECIANALDEHCIPSQFKKQIEDECAKEYEELGLKELKELIEADRKDEPTISKMEQVEEPKICDTCRYYNSYIPCGSTPSACKKADKFAEEFVDGLKKLKPKDKPQKWETPPKFEHKGDITTCVSVPMFLIKDALVEDEPQTDCAWK